MPKFRKYTLLKVYYATYAPKKYTFARKYTFFEHRMRLTSPLAVRARDSGKGPAGNVRKDLRQITLYILKIFAPALKKCCLSGLTVKKAVFLGENRGSNPASGSNFFLNKVTFTSKHVVFWSKSTFCV